MHWNYRLALRTLVLLCIVNKVGNDFVILPPRIPGWISAQCHASNYAYNHRTLVLLFHFLEKHEHHSTGGGRVSKDNVWYCLISSVCFLAPWLTFIWRSVCVCAPSYPARCGRYSSRHRRIHTTLPEACEPEQRGDLHHDATMGGSK